MWQTADEELLHALTAAQRALNADYRDMLANIAEVAARKLRPGAGYVTDLDHSPGAEVALSERLG